MRASGARTGSWRRLRPGPRLALPPRSGTYAQERARRTPRDHGQTTIEFVGVTPLIILLCVALWQCALIGFTFILAGNAADVGARTGTGAEWGQRAACVEAAKEDLPSAWSGSAWVECDGNGPGLYRAEVRLKVPILVPGVLNWDFSVEGNAASVKEG
ncbi:TadE family protein [Streptomyces sp. NPDC059092]|uniref:TadE family protein n=1 Tax=Streptomyces sp. NPDC059092 TaxID=3346725 RepID=UPI0036B72193